ncbi:MAG: pitrilysin family protein [Cyanobacteriota bacterium]|nr:pitrilysin family protein [Cyanobacteriota bacterium]
MSAMVTLSGGLPLHMIERQGPAILAARLVLAGGSGADRPTGRGGAQLLAGVMTRGCGDLGPEDLADLVEGAGAALRADASEDSLILSLKCAREDAATLLPLLIRMVRAPQLLDDQVALERQLNLQTLQRQREDPFQLAYDGLRHLLYGHGPYGHDPLGVAEDLVGLGRSDLLPLQAALGQRGAVLVLCGDAPAEAREQLDAELQAHGWTNGTAVAPGIRQAPPGATTLSCLEQDTEQLVLMLGAATVPLGHDDAQALRLLQAHLGQGMSCRLFQEMREQRGLAYDVGVHLPARRGPAPFVVHLSTSAERAAEATSCLLAEWRRLAEVPLTPAERDLALAKLRGQDAMGRQTCGQIAERQALLLSHGLPADHLDHCLARAAELGSDELQAVAQRWLSQPCLSLVGPAEALHQAEGHHPGG